MKNASRIPGRWMLCALLFIGVSNALIRPIIGAAHSQTIWQWLSSGLGINPVIWLALVLGMIRVWPKPMTPSAPIKTSLPVLMVCLLGWLVPSATLAWLGIAALCMSVIQLNRLQPSVHAGLLILLATALREPLSQLLLKVTITPLLASDAWLVATLGEFWLSGYQREGNLVINPQGFRLLILTGCTSYGNLSLVVLCWFSLTLFFTRHCYPVFLLHGLLLAAVTLMFNIARLLVMSLSESHYLYLHQGEGVAIYSTLLTALPLVACRWSLSHARTADHTLVAPCIDTQPDAQNSAGGPPR